MHLIALPGKGDAAPRVKDAADALYDELRGAAIDVLYDDRDVSPGVKFADADLLGMPAIVVVGKALADGEVEVKDRRTGERRKVAVDGVVAELSR